MSLPVDIGCLTPEQDYLIAQLSEYSEVLYNRNHDICGKTLSEILTLVSDNNDLYNLIKEMISKGLGSLKIEAVDYKSNTNFGAICFKDDYGHTGFSYKPTKDIKDVGHDINIIITGSSEENEQAKAFFYDNMDKNGCNNFLFGYSLGGNLALSVYKDFSQYVAKVNIFNALPVKDWKMSDEDKAKINQWTKDGDNVHLIDNALRSDMGIDHSNEDNFSGSNVTRDSGLGWFFGDHTRKPGWFDGNGNVVGGYSSLIEVDTWKLRDYGMRLENVQKRIIDLNEKLSTFNDPFINLSAELIKFIQNGITEFNNIFNGARNKMVGCENDYDLGKYCSYLFWTADELERIEDVVLKNELNSLDA